MQNSFQTTDKVTQDRTLFQNAAVTPRFGNLLTLPVGNGLLYVEPIYIQQKNDPNSFPQLARVLVYFGGKVGFASTFDAALDQVFGPGSGDAATQPGDDPSTTPPTTTPPGGTTQPPTGNPEVDKALADIGVAIDGLSKARQADDYAAEGKALGDLKAAIARYQALAAPAATTTTPPPTSAGGG